MKKKVFNILFALVLVVSFSLVPAVPVAADPGAVITSTDIEGPYGVGVTQEFSIRTTSDTAYDSVLFKFVVEAAVLADIASFEYYDAETEGWVSPDTNPADGTDTWLDIMPVFSEVGSDLEGYFGPLGGFPMSDTYDVTTKFRINFNTLKTYPVTISLEEVPETTPITTASFSLVVVSVELDFDEYNTGETVNVTIEDIEQSGLIAAFAWSETVHFEGKITFALFETGTGVFEGSFVLVGTTPGIGELLVNVDDQIRVGYLQVVATATVVDTTEPTIEDDTLIQPNGGEIIQGGSSYNILWHDEDITDANLLPNPITLKLSTDGGSTYPTTIATGEANDGSYTWSPVAAENSSECRVKIIASDLAENTAEDTSDADFDIDSFAPDSSIDALPNDPNTNDSTPTFSGNSVDNGTTTYVALVECKVDDGEWTAAAPDDGAFNSVSEDWSFTTAALADGEHTIYARATDAAGNVESTAEYDFSVDTVSPTVTIVTEPDDIILLTTADYAGTAADAAPSSGLSKVLYQLDDGSWAEATLDDGDWEFELTELSSGPHTVNIKAVDDATNETTPLVSHSFIVDLVPGPPVLLDAVTGWNWWFSPECPSDDPLWEGGPIAYWCYDEGIGFAFNANDRGSIMVVFSEPLDPETVDRADFTVTGKTISSIEFYNGHCNHAHQWDELSTNDFGLVFLNLTTLLATDATPTVNLAGVVSDWAGFDSEPDIVVAQDGIAPVITLSSNPVEPVYNQLVTITATATEVLSEAYCGLPTNGEGEFEPCEMTPDATGKVWTYEFLWPYPPMEKRHIKVWAHDSTDFEECKWWKHAKWTEESLIFGGGDYVDIELYEGWNLISVPKELVNPSLNDVFGDGSVTKVHHWTGYGWQSAKFNPISGTWGGAIYNIVPGKGYWVWCSPSDYHLGLMLALPDPLAPPPSYRLVAGWNLIGFTAIDYPLKYRSMSDYLFSLCDICKLVYWYEAQPQEWNRVTPTADWWPSCKDRAKPGYGYWLYLGTAGTLAP